MCVWQDALLRWMETFASRLEAGVYQVSRLIPDVPQSEGINLFPAAGDGVRGNVTPTLTPTPTPTQPQPQRRP